MKNEDAQLAPSTPPPLQDGEIQRLPFNGKSGGLYRLPLSTRLTPVDGNCIRFQEEQTVCRLSEAVTGDINNHELN
jgi:hypothetical protein